MKKKILIYSLIFFGLLAGITVYFVDPSEHPLIPCWLHELTGLECPGCGITRAVHCLLHFEFRQAFKYNAFFCLSLILVLIYGIIKIGYKQFEIKTSWLCIYLISLILFTIIRNLI